MLKVYTIDLRQFCIYAKLKLLFERNLLDYIDNLHKIQTSKCQAPNHQGQSFLSAYGNKSHSGRKPFSKNAN